MRKIVEQRRASITVITVRILSTAGGVAALAAVVGAGGKWGQGGG